MTPSEQQVLRAVTCLKSPQRIAIHPGTFNLARTMAAVEINSLVERVATVQQR